MSIYAYMVQPSKQNITFIYFTLGIDRKCFYMIIYCRCMTMIKKSNTERCGIAKMSLIPLQDSWDYKHEYERIK